MTAWPNLMLEDRFLSTTVSPVTFESCPTVTFPTVTVYRRRPSRRNLDAVDARESVKVELLVEDEGAGGSVRLDRGPFEVGRGRACVRRSWTRSRPRRLRLLPSWLRASTCT